MLNALLPALLLLLADVAPPPVDPSALRALARDALAKVEAMRGQKLHRPLKMGVKSRAQVQRFIMERLDEEYGPAKVAAEGRLLKLQGLLPERMDYGAYVTSLLTEQVAGFYDQTRQELHIAAWLPMAMQAPVMAHEIFHAIQDQEWGGGKLIDSKLYTHDEVLAHAALLEGDATLVMLNYQQGGRGLDISTSPVTLNLVAASLPAQMSSPQFPVMAAAPDYMKQSLIFPYQQGLLFIGALRQAGMSWADVRQIYAAPPSSTEQLLHPERYWPKRDEPSEVRFTNLGLKGFHATWEGTAGEFHHRQLLLASQPIVRATEAAAGWDGDHTRLLVKGRAAVSITLSVWDTPADAEDFAATLRLAEDKRVGVRPTLELRRERAKLAYAWSTDPVLAGRAVEAAMKLGAVRRR